MPPKGGPKRLLQDWSWAGTDVTTVEDITPANRRLAAGLGSKQALRGCSFRHDQRAMTVESDAESNSSIIVTRDPCGPKRCLSAPKCYNHLGDGNWFEDGARARFIEHKMGDKADVRDGPAGLLNYGATCYANAFLQVWFYDLSFRNGVYGAVSDKVNPLRHLANIFAMLEYSKRKVVDPGALIEALQLAKGNQQDAAEFSKLFMNLLNTEFQRQGYKTFLSDRFEGKLEYQMQCQKCGYTATSESTFLELDIALKDKASLEDLLKTQLQPESLDGDNKWMCRQCNSLQPAIRSTRLRQLPPVLHFSLMRFVYNLKTYERLKSSAAITYPRELILEGQKYDLRGVVSHIGRNATHGHFVSEVYDEDNHEWYECNDDEVKKLSARPRKRIRLDPDVAEEQMSKDAYMLVYKRRDGTCDPRVPIPPSLLEAIEADNTALEVEVSERGQKMLDTEQEFDDLVAAKREILACLQGSDCIVPRDGLSAWIKSDSVNTDWDFKPILCEHDKVSLDEGHNVRLISKEAFTKLKEYSSGMPEVDVCEVCVASKFATVMSKRTHAQQVELYDNLNVGNGYYLPKEWVKRWRSNNLDPPDALPTHEDYTLFCEHGQPSSSRRREEVSAESLAVLQSILGEFDAFGDDVPECTACAEDKEKNAARRATWTVEVKADRQISKQHRNMTLILGATNYLLPKGFTETWDDYMKDPGAPRPTLQLELCPHGLLDFDPQMEKADYLTEDGWHSLCEIYTHDPAQCVKVTVLGSPPEGKLRSVDDVSVATCDECRRKRLSDFGPEGRIKVTVVNGKDTMPAERSGMSRTRAKTSEVDVGKDTTIKDVKLDILHMFKISPISQNIYYNGRELDSSETIGSIGLLVGDHLNLVEVLELDDEVEDGAGFGGTALVGRIACNQCTFENAAGATQCEMCELPLTNE